MIQTPHPLVIRATSRGFGRSLSNGFLGLTKSQTAAVCIRGFSIHASGKDAVASFTTQTKRPFSFTSVTHREFFPPSRTEQIRETKPAWPHPIYTEAQMNEVKIAHREANNWSDYVALGAVRFMRWGLDFVTGYTHGKADKVGPDGTVQFAMTEKKYMRRNVFLESVAGVPGMVGGMLRHLHSMRKLKRDQGW
ncbi:MAG: hypothetical protein Q9162_002145 [Coniocarpon cinnabarinum]